MGTITESFGNLGEYLLAERKGSKKRSVEIDLVLAKLLKPFLPSGMRCGTGTITDMKDRQAGPVDIVASTDNFPAFSEGPASTYMADGVVFCLQVKDWAQNDLTEFGKLASQIKKLERKKKSPIPCLAVSFSLLPLPELTSFLNSPAGQAVDGVVCIGHHIVLRNSQGWYGNPARVPFVTESPGPEALKAFTFFLLQLSQTALGLPFGLMDYQHL
jgi:hypothetical protein